MSIFEIIMLLCFGAAWPVSIYKSFKSKTNKGKSLIFLIIIVVGYLSGIINKVMYFPNDKVVYLYGLNTLLVLIDILLFIRNSFLSKK